MNLLPKSEKWLPVIIIIWGCVLISLAFVAAWYDPDRYLSMIDAIGESIQLVIASAVAGGVYYANARMKYKGKLAELNPYFNDRFKKEVGIDSTEVKKDEKGN